MMINRILKDVYVDALGILMISLIPFFTLGFLEFNGLMYASACIGAILLIAGIGRICWCIKHHKVNETSPAVQTMVSYYSLSYAFLLSYFIMKIKGISVEFLLWFAVIMFIIATPAVAMSLWPKKEADSSR